MKSGNRHFVPYLSVPEVDPKLTPEVDPGKGFCWVTLPVFLSLWRDFEVGGAQGGQVAGVVLGLELGAVGAGA